MSCASQDMQTFLFPHFFMAATKKHAEAAKVGQNGRESRTKRPRKSCCIGRDECSPRPLRETFAAISHDFPRRFARLYALFYTILRPSRTAERHTADYGGYTQASHLQATQDHIYWSRTEPFQAIRSLIITLFDKNFANLCRNILELQQNSITFATAKGKLAE